MGKHKILLILGYNFILSILLGLFSGGGQSDASNYITLAIQIVNQNDWSQLLLLSGGREVFSLWLFTLTIGMKLLGSNWFTAIIVTSVFGSLSLWMFHKVLSIYFAESSSLFMTLMLAFYPVFLVISHNALYDAQFIFLFLIALYFYFQYSKSHRVKDIIFSGIVSSLLVFVHSSAYPYIFILWCAFPLINKPNLNLKSWIWFSVSAGFLSVMQMLIWKFVVYDSFFPYMTLVADWSQRMDSRYLSGFEIRHYFRFFLIIFLGYTPLLFLTIFKAIFPSKVFPVTKPRLIYILSFIVFLFLILGLNWSILLYPGVVILILGYLYIFKPQLLSENPVVFLFSVLTIFTFIFYLGYFPKPYFHQKHFIYPVLFIVPVFWHYAQKILESEKKIFLIAFTFIFIQFSFDIFFQLPWNMDKSPPGMKVKFSDTFIFALPFTNEGEQKQIVQWYRHHGAKPTDSIVTNRHERYVNAMLNMPQNHYHKIIDSYTFLNGFQNVTKSRTMDTILQHKPDYIHWDKELHKKNSEIISSDGNRLINFSYEELSELLVDSGYQVVDSLNNKYYFFKNLNHNVKI